MTYQTGPRTTLDRRHITMADKLMEPLRDQVFDDRLFMQWFFGDEHATPEEDGPRASSVLKALGVPGVEHERTDTDLVQFNLEYAVSTNSQAFSGLKLLRTNIDEGSARSWMSWSLHSDYCALTLHDVLRNKGPARLVDRVVQQNRVIMRSLSEAMEQEVVAGASTVGDTVEDGSQDAMPSLAQRFHTTPSTGTRQAVDSATYTWWQSQVDTSASFATSGLDKMDAVDNATSSRGGLRGSDVLFSPHTEWRYYTKQAEGIHRVTGDIKSVDLGISYAYYKNKPFVSYKLMPAGSILWLASKSLRAYTHSDLDWVERHPESPNNQAIGPQTRLFTANQWGSVEQRHHGRLVVSAA